MTPSELFNLLSDLGLQQLRDRNTDISACCPSGNHTDRRPSWGISVNAPHLHGCWACGFKGSLRTLLIHLGYSRANAMAVAGERDVDTKRLRLPESNETPEPKYFKKDQLYPFYSTVRSDLYLRLRGLTLKTIRKANLLHDRKQNRVLFPWMLNGKLVALTGRALNPNVAKQGPKMLSYLPDSDKRNNLYIPAGELKGETLIAVEGEIDALKVWQATDYANVCAAGHSDLSKGQAHLMLNSNARRVLAFGDHDSAGRKFNAAIEKMVGAQLRVTPVSYSSILSSYPAQKLDPGSLTPAEIRKLLDEARGNLFPSWNKITT